MDIKGIIDHSCLIFLWAGSHYETMEHARKIMNMWGFKIIDQITWVKTNKDKRRYQEKPNLITLEAQDSLFVTTKERCLIGARGISNNKLASQLLQPNFDVNVIVSEALPNDQKPPALYNIIENFCAGRRRIELFGKESNLRRGWVTVGDNVSEEVLRKNIFNKEQYEKWLKTAKKKV